MKCGEKLREKDGAQHRRDPNTNRRLHSRHTGVICLKLVAVLKNVSGFIIKLFAFFSKDQSVSFSIKKADAEFNFQIADSNGHSGLLFSVYEIQINSNFNTWRTNDYATAESLFSALK